MNTKKILLGTSIICIFIGIISGSVCMALSDGDTEFYNYLMRCFDSFSVDCKHFDIFKNSFFGGIKLFLIITLCAFFKAGVLGSLGCCAFKGFTSGFTTAAFVKYYGISGLLMPLSYMLSTIVLLPIVVLFSTYSASLALNKDEREIEQIGHFLCFALLCVGMLLIIALLDGYVTPTLIKFLRPFICKV